MKLLSTLFVVHERLTNFATERKVSLSTDAASMLWKSYHKN